MTASARNDVAFEGIGYDALTLKFGNTLTYDATQPGGIPANIPGRAITVTTSKVAQLAADGDPIVGKLLSIKDDGFCAVQHEGIVGLPGGNGATLTVGRGVVGALDASANKGFVRSPAATADVTGVAETQKANGRILDTTDTTNVIIDLD